MSLYPRLRSALFTLDPEQVHHLSMNALMGLASNALGRKMLATQFLNKVGLRLLLPLMAKYME